MKSTQQGVSETVCLVPIAGCLIAAESQIGGTDWKASNSQQKRFLADHYAASRGEVAALPEVESIASKKASDINEFLAARGFSIQLPEFDPNSLSFGVASVFKLLLEWIRPGTITKVRDGRYPAVLLKNDLAYFHSKRAKNPIVSIEAKNGDQVFMTAYADPPKGFDLLKLVEDISGSLNQAGGFDGVVFPMIDYDEMIDISWIQGLSVTAESGPWEIERALQQTKFRMNEVGAKVESAVAMGIRYACCAGEPNPPVVIDQPFLLWITRPGLSHPLFVAFFTESHWKKPKSL